MIEEPLEIIATINIREMIYEIRGKQVIPASDLAILFKCTNGTKEVNQVVKRNSDKFPKEFCFKLTDEESKFFWSQIVTKKEKNNFWFQTETKKNENIMRSQNMTIRISETRGGRYNNPYVFTEQGIIMLASILKSDIAVKVSVNIVNAFVEMRKFLLNNSVVFEKLAQHDVKFLDHDNKLDILFDELQKDKIEKQQIFFKGQIYDAYSLLVEIIGQAKKNIIIIDNYFDKTILDLLSKKKENVDVLIVGKNNLKLSSLDIDKFNRQYPNLRIKHSSEHHDRFIIIDKEVLYNCGASLKDLGKSTFAINKMEDKILLESLLSRI